MEHRSKPHSKRQYLLFMAATLALCVFGVVMLLANEIKEAEQIFERDTDEISVELRQRLLANDAVLSGFSALLQAVEVSDQHAAMRYAAVALAPYPHIYMLEVARQVSVTEQTSFAENIRKSSQPDFAIRSFAAITGRPEIPESPTHHVWPVVFMYPEPPDTRDIYGVRLDTVPYLLETMHLAPRLGRAVSSPIFELKEGGRAYILLRIAERLGRVTEIGLPNFFGNTMAALLLTKTESLMPSKLPELPIGFRAQLMSDAGGSPSVLIEHAETPAGWLDRHTLPTAARTIETGTASQPIRLAFHRQLRWANIISHHALFMACMLTGTMILLACGLQRHRRAVQNAIIEHERAEYLAMHDALTSLPNRYLLADRVEQALQRWQRHGAMFAMILIDLDHFKEINDSLGHEFGDAVLINAATRLNGAVRGSDTVARYGGDEFVILIADVLNDSDVLALGEKLCRLVGEPMTFGIRSMQVTCSLGIALCPSDGEDFNTLRQQADHAMYRVKKLGRNGARLATKAAEQD